MKAKVTPHRARKALPEPPIREQAEPVDLDTLPELQDMKEFIEKFLGWQLPTALECEDVINNSRHRADALLDYCADADAGRRSVGQGPEAIEVHIVDSIKLELEKMVVAGRRLREMHARATRNAEAAIDRG